MILSQAAYLADSRVCRKSGHCLLGIQVAMMEEAQRCPGTPRTEKVNHRKREPLAVGVDADSLAKFFNRRFD